jgi:UDP-N-acetylmuramyl pentapeptide phosphotransferase/UDP-N-acetylglucosamine-1-phosphate transferase
MVQIKNLYKKLENKIEIFFPIVLGLFYIIYSIFGKLSYIWEVSTLLIYIVVSLLMILILFVNAYKTVQSKTKVLLKFSAISFIISWIILEILFSNCVGGFCALDYIEPIIFFLFQLIVVNFIYFIISLLLNKKQIIHK